MPSFTAYSDVLVPLDRVYHSQDLDEAVYSLRRFVTLALRNNPSILDILFVGEDKVVFANGLGRELRSLARDFLCKRVYLTYGGYAKAQLDAMIRRGGEGTHGMRAELIAAFGVDTKNALHLIRLLRMGCPRLGMTMPSLRFWQDMAGTMLRERVRSSSLTEVAYAFQAVLAPSRNVTRSLNSMSRRSMVLCLDVRRPCFSWRKPPGWDLP